MMQAVAYLAGTQSEGLLQVPQEAVASVPGFLVAGSVGAMAVAVVALSILASQRRKAEGGQEGYAASLLA